jgi:hypothetical protein
MAGVGARSNDFRNEETEPVYLLTRRRSSFPPPPPASSRLVVAAVQESPREALPRESSPRESSQRDSLGEFTRMPDLDSKWYGEAPDDDADDDFSDIRPISRRLVRRRRAIRVLGALAILGTLAGGGYVLEQPRVRHEALSFVTMGHPDAAVRAGRRIATFVEALRHH